MEDNELIIGASVAYEDEGCDWTARLIWKMTDIARIRRGDNRPMPALVQVRQPVAFEPKKAKRRRTRRETVTA